MGHDFTGGQSSLRASIGRDRLAAGSAPTGDAAPSAAGAGNGTATGYANAADGWRGRTSRATGYVARATRRPDAIRKIAGDPTVSEENNHDQRRS